MNKLLFVCAVCCSMAFRLPGTNPALRHADEKISLENKKVALVFDKKTGMLSSLVNKITGDNYLKTPSGGNLFRLFVNTTSMPALSAGAHNDNYGGSMIDPSTCVLKDFSFAAKAGARELTLKMTTAKSLTVLLTITLPDTASFFDCKLVVVNNSNTSCAVYSSFPYFSGISLGEEPATNLAVNMWDRGYPGIKAWAANSGGVYGRDVQMQWQCVYEPALKEGLAFITMDTTFRNKILTCFPGGGMQSLYFDQETIRQGEARDWPAARVLVFNGNWRIAAMAYRSWVNENMQPRPVPAWYTKEVAMRSSTWIPTKEAVEKEKLAKGTGVITSFEQLPKQYAGGYSDCLEMGMWNEGVNLWPETYGPWMSSGFIDFRSDLGGRTAFVKGVKNVHQYGRKVAMYVAGYGIRTTSPLFKGDDWKNWAIMTNAQGKISFEYRGEKDDEVFGIFTCPGYKPWQDNMIRVCTMLAKAGVDEIRLDEIGFPFRPCFNPAHHHESPYDCHRWMREYLRRIREAVDKINPDMVISTEFFMDYFHTYTNGALVMDCSGSEIDAMKVAMPSYLALSYHAGAAEAAITGAVMSKPESHRLNWAWGHVGTSSPADYPPGPGAALPWYELYPLFATALTRGDLTEWDPVSLNDSGWIGHLWKDTNYWVLTGGHEDATPLVSGGAEIQLPELPPEITHAFEFDVATAAMHEIPIVRNGKGIFIRLQHAVSAVFFPLPDCPPLPMIAQLQQKNGASAALEVKLKLFAPWKPESEKKNMAALVLKAPGFTVSKKQVQGNTALFEIKTPQKTDNAHYFFQVTGNCLPLKKWFSIGI
ncbi:DUF6259 domain-containing protein [Chitinophaga sp. MM2321]|uniref:DUF6259 domain-containing protein n=1 Tax=Chitinophaga sp. MM2321 TaxID=3137178 RepID=UPI0032D5B14E